MFSTNSSAYKLFNENNLDFMKRLPDSSIDLILTDPPYNLSQFSRGNIHLNNGKTINNKIAEWDSIPLNPNDYIEPFTRIIKPTGNIFIFTSYSLLGKWYDAFNPLFLIIPELSEPPVRTLGAAIPENESHIFR